MSGSKIYLSMLISLLGSQIAAFSQNKSTIDVSSFVTADTLFNKPYIDIDEWRETPVHHHYVHGGFKGSDTRFSFYFPAKENYKGHFFQYITPVPDNENISQSTTGEENRIDFCVSHGAYFIETNGGGAQGLGMPGSKIDPTIGAYRANAAVAAFSRVVAEQFFEKGRPFGYAYGGSGGAFRTIGGIENTDGVWDGAVPYVLGSPVAIPNVFTVRVFAMQVLHDKFPQIVDAMEPGASADMYAGLNNEEKEALKEATRMGFPPHAWFNYNIMGLHAFPVLYPGMTMVDPKYFKDFWTQPGYLGANPPEYLTKARLQKATKIKALINSDQAAALGLVMADKAGEARGTADAAWKSIGGQDGTMPVAFQVDDQVTNGYFLGGDLVIKTGAAAGKKLFLTDIKGDKLVFGTVDAKVLINIKPGDEVYIDNSDFLAAETYHRHQVPKKEYQVWDQFINADGKPIYPQRPMLLGPLFTKFASGVLPAGKFKGKMILLESLWDSEAFPWQADWYRSRVKENLGDSLDSHFRLWYTDHANHGDNSNPGDPVHLVSYLGVLQQALLDLSDWVEKGTAPPASTNYKIEDGQVIVPATAIMRKGIQPVLSMKVNGSEKAEIAAGKPVTINAIMSVPPDAGKIVEVEMDFEGKGYVPVKETSLISSKSGAEVKLTTTYTFKKPGTYFPTLRATSQRQGDKNTVYTRIRNLSRVRVIVK